MCVKIAEAAVAAYGKQAESVLMNTPYLSTGKLNVRYAQCAAALCDQIRSERDVVKGL